ncbi:MAG: hypothetical protein GY833_12825 [Aestuariibacter sp.]|nr:hypothetical protein [Aestuariibacter sp.]
MAMLGLNKGRPILETTLKLPKHSMVLEICHPDMGKESRLSAKLTYLELKHFFPEWDADKLLDHYCAWYRKPQPIELAPAYVMYGAPDSRGVNVVELHTMYMQREPLTGGAQLVFPIRPQDVTYYQSRLANTVKALFPEFYTRQSLEQAKAIIAKLSTLVPKPSLTKPKPPLKRLSNERWWRNQ